MTARAPAPLPPPTRPVVASSTTKAPAAPLPAFALGDFDDDEASAPADASSAGQAAASSSTPLTPAAIKKLLRNETTWAEILGVTRSEAFGIAQSAYRLFEFGQHERARRMIAGLVELNPKVGAFHALLGAMAGRMGDDDAALASYSQAIRVEPNNLAARVNRAEMRLKAGNIADALDDLVAATRLDPQGKSPLGKRALSLARTTSTALKELLSKAPQKPAPRR